MVNELSYNHLGLTSPDEQAQARTGFGTKKAGTLQTIWLHP